MKWGFYIGTPDTPAVGMDEFEYDDPSWRDIKSRLVQEAQRKFEAFYRKASIDDAKVLDALVMTRHVFQHLSATSRHFLVPDMRQALERQNHHAEQVFIHLVDVIRASETFAGLSSGDVAEMERNLFDPDLRFGE